MRIYFLFLPAMLFMSCKNSEPRRFDLEGHRGCRGLMPENTVPAMLRAIDLHVNTLEMDVVITADKKVLVSHEPFFSHEITTLPSGETIPANDEWNYNIYQMTYDSVKLYDVGLKRHPRFPSQEKMKVGKPLLADLVDSVEAYCAKIHYPKVNYNIEIKSLDSTDNVYHPAPEEYAELLMNVINDKQIADRVIIQSFDIRSLQVMRRKYPAMKLSYLIDTGDTIPLKGFKKRLGFKPEIISPDYSLLNQEITDALHKQHVQVIPWTVDDIDAAKKLYKWGVDGIITDYPDKINVEAIRSNL
ncbi:MAG: glycerophosphodiester phosphodiesterase family protein [Ginsengibacter sp.]